jgi:phosphoglycolate phosphatase
VNVTPSRPTVFLFDIDGTLVLTGGAGRRAMLGAFARVTSIDVFADVSFAGMTDRAIARHGLRTAHALDPHGVDEAAIDDVLESYLALLAEELGRADKYQVLPGVLDVLAHLAALPNVAIGLGTGNVRRGAYVKLGRGGLDGHFTFGGFGCDAEDRTELLRVGSVRGAERLGHPVSACEVVVIGDTPKDVSAAKGIGARCIGVGTGSYPASELRACGAEHAFDDLAAAGVIPALFAAT